MADNPFDQFDAPKTNPFDQFDKPPLASDIVQPTDSLPALNPLTATTGDYLAKLHQAAGGLGQIGQFADDMVRHATNVGGVGDWFASHMGGTSAADEHAKTAAADARLPPEARVAADFMGYGPFGALGIGGKVAQVTAPVAGRVGGRIIGSGVEGATTSGVTSYGRGDSWSDIGKNTLFGGTVGLGTGILPAGGAGERPTTPATSELEATSQSKFAPLRSKAYDASDVGGVFGKVTAGLDAGDAVSMGPRLADMRDLIAKEIADRGTVTANDIATFNRKLMDAAGGSADRQRIAGQYVAALNKGVGSRTAADIKAANAASGVAKTSGEIEGWTADAANAPKAVKGALADNPNFYQQPGVYDALKKVADRAPSGDVNIGKEVSKVIAKHLISGAITGGTTALFGGGLPTDLTAAGVGTLLPLLGGRYASSRRTAQTANDLRAARHLLATGQAIPPEMFQPSSPTGDLIGELARRGGYVAGTAGAPGIPR